MKQTSAEYQREWRKKHPGYQRIYSKKSYEKKKLEDPNFPYNNFKNWRDNNKEQSNKIYYKWRQTHKDTWHAIQKRSYDIHKEEYSKKSRIKYLIKKINENKFKRFSLKEDLKILNSNLNPRELSLILKRTSKSISNRKYLLNIKHHG